MNGREFEPQRIVLFGAGGHAQVVLEILLSAGHQVVGLLDSKPELQGQSIFGVPILGGDDQLAEAIRQGATHFLVGVGSVGDASIRRNLFALGLQNGLLPAQAIHPASVISPSAIIGRGTAIMANAVVNANAVVGENVILNTGAIVEHDCKIGNHAHVATGAQLASTVVVGEGAHIGAGATVIQCKTIGEGAVIGAGAVVTKDIPARVVAAGIPARAIRQLGAKH